MCAQMESAGLNWGDDGTRFHRSHSEGFDGTGKNLVHSLLTLQPLPPRRLLNNDRLSPAGLTGSSRQLRPLPHHRDDYHNSEDCLKQVKSWETKRTHTHANTHTHAHRCNSAVVLLNKMCKNTTFFIEAPRDGGTVLMKESVHSMARLLLPPHPHFTSPS